MIEKKKREKKKKKKRKKGKKRKKNKKKKKLAFHLIFYAQFCLSCYFSLYFVFIELLTKKKKGENAAHAAAWENNVSFFHGRFFWIGGLEFGVEINPPSSPLR